MDRHMHRGPTHKSTSVRSPSTEPTKERAALTLKVPPDHDESVYLPPYSATTSESDDEATAFASVR